MFTEVDENSPKTKKFRQHIIAQLAENCPLEIGRQIEITTAEEDTYFPTFIENPLKDEWGNVIATIDEIEQEGEILKFEGENQSKSVEIINDNKRRFFREKALIKYVKQTFKPICLVKLPHVISRKPLAVLFPFLIKKPQAICGEEKNVGIILFFNPSGYLWREPKEKYCYRIKKESDRLKIMLYLAKDNKYHLTKDISVKLSGKNKQLIRSDIKGINITAARKLRLSADKLIEGEEGSGYRINPKYTIRISIY